MNTLELQIDDRGVAIITIDLPDRSVNVVSPELTDDLEAAVNQVLADESIVGAVLTSGKSSFIVGADLTELVHDYAKGMTAAEASHRFDRNMQLQRRMETGGKPFACAINGMALGGGLEIALACHYRVLADDSKAMVGLPEVNVGLLPGGGGTQRLPRMIGVENALPLLLNGNHVSAQKALELGIVDAVVPRDEVVSAARDWVLAHRSACQPWDVKGYKPAGGSGPLAANAISTYQLGTTIAKRSGAGNYPAPLGILSAVFEGLQLPIDKALQVESKYFGKLLADPVARNLIRTQFIRKGEAAKLARRPADAPAFKVRQIGVIGAGMMGAGIAYAAAAAGIQVVLLDTSLEAAERGKAYSAKVAEKEVARGRSTPSDADALLARIRVSTAFDTLSNCDLVVEAVFEDRTIKASVTTQAVKHMNPEAVLASNTSTLSITSLAQNAVRPEQYLGMHFFSPVDRMPLVEVIRGRDTSDATLARALDLVAQMKKVPIVVNDGPGFFTSRVYCAFVDEAMQMVQDGVSPALIENAALLAGMPVSPLAVIDETTIGLRWAVIQQAREDKLDERYTHPVGSLVCERMFQLGRNGRKSGGGFYDYPADGSKKRLWSGLSQEFAPAKQQPDASEIRLRLLTIQALEAARCLEEGILDNAHEGDLGSTLGVGYPTWTGGALSYIDTVGASHFVQECERLAQVHGARYAPSTWLSDRALSGKPMVADPAQA